MVGLEDIMSTGLGPARKAAGLTQAQLGERINVHPPHIARWETGGVLPRVDMAIVIAQALGTTVEAIWPPAENRAVHT
jgi:putative transcriptional regulator